MREGDYLMLLLAAVRVAPGGAMRFLDAEVSRAGLILHARNDDRGEVALVYFEAGLGEDPTTAAKRTLAEWVAKLPEDEQEGWGI